MSRLRLGKISPQRSILGRRDAIAMIPANFLQFYPPPSVISQAMLRNPLSKVLLLAATAYCGTTPGAETAGDSPAYLLESRRAVGDATKVTISLEVGGDLIVTPEAGGESKLPMSVAAKLAYQEQIVDCGDDPSKPARSLRRYREANATIKTDQQGVERQLPLDRRMIVAEVTEDAAALNGLGYPLSREQFDLINVACNTIAIDRLLPGRELPKGDGWDHDAATMACLLGMDHVAVCEVRSVVTGEENRQVQIRLAGTVHGTVDGAASEMDLRGAYLYHLDEGRITKLNVAIKEVRKVGEVSPGLDVVAKLSVVALPLEPGTAPFDGAILEQAREVSGPALRQLLVDAPSRGYQFCHDSSWFVTAEHRERMSLRLMESGNLLAHCNLTSLPTRVATEPKGLGEFEKEVCDALGAKVETVEAAREWTTANGNRCLGVFVNGAVEEAPIQWRYYHVSNDGGAQATIAVTVEQSLLERFADADRPIVDSLELIDVPLETPAAEKPIETAEQVEPAEPAETAVLEIGATKK